MVRVLSSMATAVLLVPMLLVATILIAPAHEAGALAPSARAPMLVLGDSLCLGARDYGGNLTAQLRSSQWEPEYACASGQWITWGIQQVRLRESVPRTVVVALGTNGGPAEPNFSGKLATMRDELTRRGARQIIWVDYANSVDAYRDKNATLRAFAIGRGDLYVAWNDRIQAHPEWFASDGLHYTVEGVAAWASAIAETSATAHLRSSDVAVDVAIHGSSRWILMASGEVYVAGTAVRHGDVSAIRLNGAPRAIVPTATGGGYWIMGADGGVFSFGDAAFHGSTGGMRLNAPVVSMARAPGGGGYWLVASDGGIFSYGTATFHGSTGGMRLNEPVIGMAVSPSGGYWLLASDGGVFSFGGAVFHGSTGGIVLNEPIVDVVATTSGGGYWLAASDGGIFNFGDAAFKGSAVGSGSPTVALESWASGYVQLLADARLLDRP